MKWLSRFLDWTSEFLATRKGLLPLIGILFIILNLLLQFLVPYTWLSLSNLFLHLGVIIAIFGLMLAWAL
ncbi:MAG: hypothetical protein D6770_01165 [Anaerolineae bacterium]|nr:MAG: hypothetical protein D6770_01165 [Anaerolineae bacterium]